MAGKYAHIIDRLPRLLNTEPKYQEKVDAVKQEMLTVRDMNGEVVALKRFLPATELGRTYIEIRNEIDNIEARLSEANLHLEATSQLMTEQYEVEDVSSLTFAGVGSVRTQYEPYAKVTDKEAFREWCINICQLCGLHRDKHPADSDHRATTLERQLQLWPSTTNSITKERLLAGQREPDGVEAFSKVKIVLTREK